MKNYIFYLLIFPLFLNAQINVFINDIENANSGDGIIIPIVTDDVTNQNVFSYYTKIVYDDTKLQFLGLDINNTLSDQWPGNPYSTVNQGEITIGMYGIQPMIGNGDLFNLFFNVINDDSNSTSIEFSYFLYNEGNPEVVTQDGNIYFNNIIYGCLDSQACNYNSEATDDDGSCIYPEVNYDCAGNCIVDIDCAGECGGNAIIDECGVCDGDGIADGACDCAGNVEDCAGECGGDAIIDECGICNGNGIEDGYCDCDGNVEDCAGECGGDAIIDECGVCNGDGSSCLDDIFGCTYEIALNYNAEATIDDGSCEFPQPGNVNGDDYVNIQDIIIIINIILGN